MDSMESFRHSRKRGADEELRDVFSGLATRTGIEPAGYQGVVSQAFSMSGVVDVGSDVVAWLLGMTLDHLPTVQAG